MLLWVVFCYCSSSLTTCYIVSPEERQKTHIHTHRECLECFKFKVINCFQPSEKTCKQILLVFSNSSSRNENSLIRCGVMIRGQKRLNVFFIVYKALLPKIYSDVTFFDYTSLNLKSALHCNCNYFKYFSTSYSMLLMSRVTKNNAELARE